MSSRSSVQRPNFPEQQPEFRVLTLAETESVSGGWTDKNAPPAPAPQAPPGGSGGAGPWDVGPPENPPKH